MKARIIEHMRAVAFDLDGTLIDTASDLAAAANATLAALGYAPLAERRIAAFIGDGIDRLLHRVLADSNRREPEPATLAAAGRLFRQAYAERLFVRSRVYPGVIEGLAALRTAGIRLCCVTNKHSAFTLPLLEAAGLAGFFAFALCADRAEQRKPRPDLVIAALERFSVAPRELLFVGDSRADIAAARAAGCPVIAVDYGYNQGRALAEEHPDGIIGNITELVALPSEPCFANSEA